MDYSSDQQRILDHLLKWTLHPEGGSLTIGGYAGTGKTTLIGAFRQELKQKSPDLKVGFACYTGKASQILKQKLQEQKAVYIDDFCGTIHSLMYSPKVDDQGKITSWRKNQLIPYQLLVVDEASMVTEDIWIDLCSYNIPIVAVGDHGQLPPIGGNFNLLQSPQLRLEQLHRHAEGNPIIEIATFARTTGNIPYQTFSPTVKKISKGSDEAGDLLENVLTNPNKDVLLLCGNNWTRNSLNKRVRNLRGYESEQPQVKEKLICLKNNYNAEGGPIYNGMIGEVLKISPSGEDWYETELDFTEQNQLYEGKISKHQINNKEIVEAVKGLPRQLIGDRFDFGYALTVHKAQGSQSETVILFEERSKYWDQEQWQRWLYTAVTRAVDNLYIIG